MLTENASAVYYTFSYWNWSLDRDAPGQESSSQLLPQAGRAGEINYTAPLGAGLHVAVEMQCCCHHCICCQWGFTSSWDTASCSKLHGLGSDIAFQCKATSFHLRQGCTQRQRGAGRVAPPSPEPQGLNLWHSGAVQCARGCTYQSLSTRACGMQSCRGPGHVAASADEARSAAPSS